MLLKRHHLLFGLLCILIFVITLEYNENKNEHTYIPTIVSKNDAGDTEKLEIPMEENFPKEQSNAHLPEDKYNPLYNSHPSDLGSLQSGKSFTEIPKEHVQKNIKLPDSITRLLESSNVTKEEEKGVMNSAKLPPMPYLDEKCYKYEGTRASNICCKMHQYTADDLQLCSLNSRRINNSGNKKILKKSKWLFVGDSRVFQIYLAFGVLFWDKEVAYTRTNSTTVENGAMQDLLAEFDVNEKFHHGFSWTFDYELHPKESPLILGYYWDQGLERLPRMIETWLQNPDQAPDILFIEGGLHHQMWGEGVAAFMPYVKELTTLLPKLRKLNTNIFIQKIDPLLFLEDETKAAASIAGVPVYNDIMSTLASDADVAFMTSGYPLALQYVEECYQLIEAKKMTKKRMWDGYVWRCDDEFHMGLVVLQQDLNMLLNHVCNSHMPLDQQYCL